MVLSDELETAAQGRGDADLAQITDYLDAGGDINDTNEDGDTMLALNILYEGDDDADDRFKTVRLLLARGADVHTRCHAGLTPLYQACNCEDQKFGLGAIRCLLEAGANIDQKADGDVEESPLSTSLDWLRHDPVGWKDIGLSYVTLLLRYGPDLDRCWGDRSAEDCLRHIEEPDAFPELRGTYHRTYPPVETEEQFLACKKLITDERHRRYLLQRKEVLRLRSLSIRGRAKKSSDAMLEPSFRLPDGVLWNVLSFWPPRRPKTFSRALTYTGPRPGWVFTTREGRTGYWIDVQLAPAPWREPPAGARRGSRGRGRGRNRSHHRPRKSGRPHRVRRPLGPQRDRGPRGAPRGCGAEGGRDYSALERLGL